MSIVAEPKRWRKPRPDPYIPEDLLVEDLLEFSRRFGSLPDSGWSEYELVLRQHPSQFSLNDFEVSHETRS